MTKQLLMGNEAFAQAALEAGVNVVAGYPGTPSSELVETVAKRHSAGVADGVHVEWSTNEKAALELLAGAAYCGARSLFTCKQMGLNVASDPLMCVNYIGVKGGLVLFVADDPGPISSQTEQDTRRFGAFAKVPVLDPSTPDEGFAMMKAAFDLSERYQTPVIVRPTTRICHASTFFDIEDTTVARPLPEEGFEKDSRWVIFPKRAYEAHGEILERLTAMANDFAADPVLAAFNPSFEGGTAQDQPPRLGIVAGGVSAAYAREALRILEQQTANANVALPAYRFISLGTPYPFPEDTALAFAEGIQDVIVFEELDCVLEEELLKLAGRHHLPWQVHGKLTGEARDRGENSTDDIALRLARFFDAYGERTEAEQGSNRTFQQLLEQTLGADAQCAFEGTLPVRPPVLCPGCPHRGSFYAVKRALGKTPAVLCGDIGCYTLGNAAPLDAVDTCLCMGAGITMAQGMAVADPAKKAVAFVGDSTYFASGLTGIANAVYNGHDITVVVLDNATTAMTGSQPHPGTGVTLMGEHRKSISIEDTLSSLGVTCIVEADPLDAAVAQAAAEEALAFEGPSALIFRAPCIQLIRPAEPAVVDAERCTGCKRCITEIGCPAIGFGNLLRGPKSKERGQAFVDASLCNGCNLCLQICPFDALVSSAAPLPTPAIPGDVTQAESADELGCAPEGETQCAEGLQQSTAQEGALDD